MKWLLIFLSLMLLGACKDDSAGAGMPKQFEPVVNPHPKYFMTIKGYVSPSIADKIQLKWVAIYSTTNPKCDKTYNSFEGVVGWRQIKVPFIAKLDKNSRYQFKIPLDYYESGLCEWKIASVVDYSGETHLANGIAQFYPCGKSATCLMASKKINPIYKKQALYELLCAYDNKEKLACKATPDSFDFSNDLNIPRTNNYLFTENYFLKTKDRR